jgi:SAM-dependent methyltransferase
MSSGSDERRRAKIQRPGNHADLERQAAQWEEQVLPSWEQPLVPALVQATPLPATGSVLIAEARTGLAVEQVAQIVPPDVRCVAIDPSREMLDLARAKRQLGDRRVFWDARGVDKLPYQRGVFDAAICAHGVATKEELQRVGAELARVTRPGGSVGLLVPLSGCFSVFYDLFREGLARQDKPHLEANLDALMDELFDVESLRFGLSEVGLREAQIHPTRFAVPFASGESFLLSPLVGAVFLPRWFQLCPQEDVREATFSYVIHALDTYYHGLPMELEAEIAWVIAQA